MMRTAFSIGTIVFMVALVAYGTNAFFTDPERSTGNTFAAGELNLEIDNESYYNGALNDETSWALASLSDGQGPGPDGGYFFFYFDDVKPDDEGEDTISIHVDDNDAWACLSVSVRDFDDNGCNEPESVDGDNDCGDDEGELQNEINFVWWNDDGDNVLEVDEAEELIYGPETLADLEFEITLADSSGLGLFGPGPLTGGETYYLGKAWCFGDLTLTPVAQDGLGKNGDNGPLDRGTGIACDGTHLDNTTQTDSVMGDIVFSAVQSRHNPAFRCFDDRPQCVVEETYADEVVSVDQGKRKNGTDPALDRSDPTDALGAPQHPLGLDYDNPVVPGSFFALGFPQYEGDAEIVLSFNNNVIVNGPGADLKLWEVTGGTSYPDEKVDVFVGDSSTGPWTLVGDDVTRDAEIDLGSVLEAQYVRIVDASTLSDFDDVADGYDLDAIQALNCVVPEEEV